MDPFDPFDPDPPGGDGRRLDRLLVWAATAGALGCSALIFVLTNVAVGPEPVAEPAPTTDTAFPMAASSTITTTTTVQPTTTTTTATTTVAAPATTTAPKTTTTTTRVTTTTTSPPPPTTTRRCAAAGWQRDTPYNGGSVVAYGGRLWMAKWWNYNAVPGANQEGVWVEAQTC